MNSRVLVALFALCFVCSVSAQSSTWSVCSGTTPAGLTVTNVTLSPDPPKLGQDDVVTLFGTAAGTVSGGNIALTISFSGFPLLAQNFDLCSAVKGGCPVSAGPVTAALTIPGTSLPPTAPLGAYTSQAVITDSNGNTLTCVEVDFTLTN